MVPDVHPPVKEEVGIGLDLSHLDSPVLVEAASYHRKEKIINYLSDMISVTGVQYYLVLAILQVVNSC